MAANEAEAVLVRHQGAIIRLVLNRPSELNAFDGSMAAALLDQLDLAAADPGCRCLTITGAGKGFCAGQSLSDGPNGLPRDVGALVRSRYMPLVTRMRNLPIPVVAEVNGVAAGAGFALALAADIRLASEHAWFSCAFSKIGLVPDSGASFFLSRYLGASRAFEIAATSRQILPAEALALGLVAHVYPADSFADECESFAQTLAAGPTGALGLTKRALNLALSNDLGAQLELEAELQQEASETDDFQEGIAAFREKRTPRFVGH